MALLHGTAVQARGSLGPGSSWRKVLPEKSYSEALQEIHGRYNESKTNLHRGIHSISFGCEHRV